MHAGANVHLPVPMRMPHHSRIADTEVLPMIPHSSRVPVIVFFAAWLCLAPVFAAEAEVTEAQSKALHALFEADWQRQLRDDPMTASYVGDARYNDRLPDLRPGAIAAQQEAVRTSLAALERIDREELTAADQLNYDIYLALLQDTVAGQRFRTELMPVDHEGGVHSFAVSATQVLRFATSRDYRDWIARLRGYGALADQTIALMREGLRTGWTPPQAILVRAPAQIAAQANATPEASSFYAPFAKMPDSIPAAEQSMLRKEAHAAVAEVVLPALKRFQTFFNDEYFPGARKSIAAGDLPDGKPYYDYLARSYTTTELSADAIHVIGLKEVARIRAEMEKIRQEVKFEGSLAEFFTHLRTDSKFFHTSPEALLTAYRAMSRRIDPELLKVFGKLPRTPYGIVPIPASSAPDTTTAYYNGPAADGSRAGNYFVNLYKPDSRPIWEMMPLSLHEAVPGHHLQIALALEQPDQPMFRRMSSVTAYVEGWALYAERLGYDMGLRDDPYDRMGQLAYDMWRAVRLVVDTGMHAKGWSRARAIAYFKDNAPKTEQDITNEIDRYIGTPGQALAYKIGQLKISELRARGESKLGDGFDLRAFHDELLGTGAVPLSVMETRMEAWIADRAAAHARERARP